MKTKNLLVLNLAMLLLSCSSPKAADTNQSGEGGKGNNSTSGGNKVEKVNDGNTETGTETNKVPASTGPEANKGAGTLENPIIDKSTRVWDLFEIKQGSKTVGAIKYTDEAGAPRNSGEVEAICAYYELKTNDAVKIGIDITGTTSSDKLKKDAIAAAKNLKIIVTGASKNEKIGEITAANKEVALTDKDGKLLDLKFTLDISSEGTSAKKLTIVLEKNN